MPPFVKFIIYRLISLPVTLFLITSLLYAIVMVTPAETRATLYLPKRISSRMTEEQYQNLINQIIKRHHLNDPYPVQYMMWVNSLLRGTWGYSPVMQTDVLSALLARTPATAELTLYSIFLFVPVGMISGVIAGWKKDKSNDRAFRLSAFIATSIPPFILAFFLLSVFYVGLGWFPPERLSLANSFIVKSEAFRSYTGLLTIDGLLNNRPEISLDAARHLVLPVFTLCLVHWATLGRVTRATIVEELGKDYILAAHARGIKANSVVWRHALPNAIAPALTSSMLSAASLVTGVFIVEIIYGFHGVSDLIVRGMRMVPDAPAALGFAVYSTVVVLVFMFLLDILQALLDPRYKEGILRS